MLSCIWFFAALWIVTTRLLFPWDFPGKSTGVGCHSFLQGIFLTRGSKSDLLLGKWILYRYAIWEARRLGWLPGALLFLYSEISSDSLVPSESTLSLASGRVPAASSSPPVLSTSSKQARLPLPQAWPPLAPQRFPLPSVHTSPSPWRLLLPGWCLGWAGFSFTSGDSCHPS